MPKKKSEISLLTKKKELIDKAGTRASRNKLKKIKDEDFTGLGMKLERAFKFKVVEGRVGRAGKAARREVKMNLAESKRIKRRKKK